MKNRMIWKTVVLFLAFTLVLSLAACSTESNDNASETTKEDETTVVSTEKQEDAATQEKDEDNSTDDGSSFLDAFIEQIEGENYLGAIDLWNKEFGGIKNISDTRDPNYEQLNMYHDFAVAMIVYKENGCIAEALELLSDVEKQYGLDAAALAKAELTDYISQYVGTYHTDDLGFKGLGMGGSLYIREDGTVAFLSDSFKESGYKRYYDRQLMQKKAADSDNMTLMIGLETWGNKPKDTDYHFVITQLDNGQLEIRQYEGAKVDVSLNTGLYSKVDNSVPAE